ncbi:Phospholipase B1, membrane-associated, partial [Melipona quadrifasciata]
LSDNLPRTFVILHVIPHLKELVAARQGGNFLKCYLTTTFFCPCLFALQFRDQRQKYYEILQRWQEIEEEVVDYPEFHRNDFTVVVSPILKHVKIPLAEDGYIDLSYLSADLANNLWNTLLEPVGNKSTTWISAYEKFVCPTAERPFLMTRENSKGINEMEG